MTAAFAFKIEEIEADASLVAGATKECFDCDPDNPRAVPRKSCRTCGGSGRQELAASQIAEELIAAQNETDTPDEGGGDNGSEDSDLYLDY
jgi:hypothetical protein